MTQETLLSTSKNWHSVAVEAVLKAFNSNQDGLDESQVQQRLIQYGLNQIPAAKKQSVFVRFLLQFHNILIYVLIGSAIVAALLGQWVDSGVILAVVLINAIIGFVQEGKAEKAIDMIRDMLSLNANVLRNGMRKQIDATNLVPGDIVLLEAGDKVPADIRLIDVKSMSVQEAILTGESVAVDKSTEVVDEECALGDRACMTYSGTIVVTGQAVGVVVATGSATQIGKIGGLIGRVKKINTPLLTQMHIFAKWLTVLILLVAALLLLFGYFVVDYTFSYMFMTVIGLSVAAIPEGLPAVLTITLALGVQVMAKRNVIVRHLPAIETLGAVSVICTDKTGTLTRNEMMVVQMVCGQQVFTMTGEGYAISGDILLNEKPIKPADYPVIGIMANAALYCNDARLQDGKVLGDPMEGALLAMAGKVSADCSEERLNWQRLDAIPFDAQTRFMATLNMRQDERMVFVKGAPEQILQMSQNQFAVDGGFEPLNKQFWLDKTQEVASHGQRVLALAVKTLSEEIDEIIPDDIDDSLTLVGIVGLLDPPREHVIEAVNECFQAGIEVKMITGDHATTAAAIGEQIGLKNPKNVLTGADIDKMSDEKLRRKILDCNVFARTSPENKLRLVMALQSYDMTVAMTGDGVNDAPALKRADAGVAMGQKGAQATREAADLVLVDDNFSSIVAAVKEGRTVYRNIQKVIGWTLPTSTGAAMCIIVALLLGLMLPVTPVQILWVNLITTATLGIALAFEPSEAQVMKIPPRMRNAPLLTSQLVWYIILVSLLFLCGVFAMYFYAINKGYSVALARTIVLNTLVVMGMFNLFFVRNMYNQTLSFDMLRGTKVIWIVVFIVIIAQFAVTYLAPLQKIFDTQAVSFFDGMLIVAVGAFLFVFLEIEKRIRFAFR